MFAKVVLFKAVGDFYSHIEKARVCFLINYVNRRVASRRRVQVTRFRSTYASLEELRGLLSDRMNDSIRTSRHSRWLSKISPV